MLAPPNEIINQLMPIGLDGAKDRQREWEKRNKDVDFSNAKAERADIGDIKTF